MKKPRGTLGADGTRETSVQAGHRGGCVRRPLATAGVGARRHQAWFHIKIGGDELEGEKLALVAMALSLMVVLVVALWVGLGYVALVGLLGSLFLHGGIAH